MKNLILTLIFTIPLTLWGQGWVYNYGGWNDDVGKSIKQTNDGGYVIAGHTFSYGNNDNDTDPYVYLLKINDSGTEQWSKKFGGISYDYGYSVQQTNDGGFIVAGYTLSYGNGSSDVYLIKTDENGSEQWSKTFGGSGYDYGYSVQQTNDGGYIIVGTTTGKGFFIDVYLIKTDENGNEQWSKNFGGTNVDDGFYVQQTTDGGYIIVGETQSFGNGSSDIYLIKTDESGIEQWSKTFGGAENDRGSCVQQTMDGGYIIIGNTNNDNLTDESSDTYLIKTDENGGELWSQTFEFDDGSFVQQTMDGGYIITGNTNSYESGIFSDIYLIKIDGNGSEVWSQTFGENNSDYSYSVQQTNDEGYVITGYNFSSMTDGSDVYVIKTNQFGNITSTFEIPLPNPNRKLEKTINLKGQEVKPQKNTPIIEIFDDGSVEKKLIIEK